MNSIYFNGRCKALETKLLSDLQLNELVKCREVVEVTNLLNSYNFLKGESVANFEDLLSLIEREEKEFLAFLKRSTPNENFTKLSVSFLFLKIGFLLIIIGNSYYFGHYLLSLIFRPISIQYAPYELKNEYYIKANRKLLNALKTNKKKYIQKLKDVKS